MAGTVSISPLQTSISKIIRAISAVAVLFEVPRAVPTIGLSFRLRRRVPHDPADIDRVIDAFAREPNGGLIVTPSNAFYRHSELIVTLANRNRLPAVYSDRLYMPAGGLMSYGADRMDNFPRAADYVDRILRGEKPADLPVQVPTKYELVINLKTAKALGITISRDMLLIADEVIE